MCAQELVIVEVAMQLLQFINKMKKNMKKNL